MSNLKKVVLPEGDERQELWSKMVGCIEQSGTCWLLNASKWEAASLPSFGAPGEQAPVVCIGKDRFSPKRVIWAFYKGNPDGFLFAAPTCVEGCVNPEHQALRMSKQPQFLGQDKVTKMRAIFGKVNEFGQVHTVPLLALMFGVSQTAVRKVLKNEVYVDASYVAPLVPEKKPKEPKKPKFVDPRIGASSKGPLAAGAFMRPVFMEPAKK